MIETKCHDCQKTIHCLALHPKKRCEDCKKKHAREYHRKYYAKFCLERQSYQKAWRRGGKVKTGTAESVSKKHGNPVRADQPLYNGQKMKPCIGHYCKDKPHEERLFVSRGATNHLCTSCADYAKRESGMDA